MTTERGGRSVIRPGSRSVGKQRLQHGSPQMLVYHRGVDVADLGALRETVDHEGVERVRVRDAEVKEEVAAAGDDEDAHDLGELGRPVAEALDVLAGGWADGHRDQRLDMAAQGLWGDRSVVARDDAGRVQGAGSFRAG